MPLLTTVGFAIFLDQDEAIDVPLARMILQLILLLLFPVALGMSLRRWRNKFVERHGQTLRRLSICALTALVTGQSRPLFSSR
jgi:BASS family bile acid:Na+ symporter